MKIRRSNLKNGIQFIHYYMPATQSVTCCILCNIGSSSERKDEYGMAHFLEHMIFEGSKKYPDIVQVHFDLEKYGIIENAWTMNNITNYWMKMPIEYVAKGLDILINRVFYPLLPEQSVTKQKQIVLEEIRMGKDDPEKVAWLHLQKHIFRDTTLSHPVIGYERTVSKFTRSMVQRFHQKFYHADNTIFWIGGNISFQKSKKILEMFTIPKGKTSTRRKKFHKTHVSFRSYFIQKDINVCHAYLGINGFHVDLSDLEYLLLAQYILGYGRGSKLYQALKIHKGLASSVESELVSFAEEGLLLCEIISKRNQVKKAVQEALSQLSELYKGKISDVEFERGKNLLLAEFLNLQETSEQFGYTELLFNLMRREILTHKKIDYDIVVKKIQTATKKKLVQAFRKIAQHASIMISIVGPDKRVNKSIQGALHKYSWE
jgi:zinc protease